MAAISSTSVHNHEQILVNGTDDGRMTDYDEENGCHIRDLRTEDLILCDDEFDVDAFIHHTERATSPPYNNTFAKRVCVF
jgi:hypothetical protein